MFRRLKIKRALHDAKITRLAYQRMMYRIENTMATMTVKEASSDYVKGCMATRKYLRDQIRGIYDFLMHEKGEIL